MNHEKIFKDEIDVRYLFFPSHSQSNTLLITFSSFPEIDMLPQYDFVDCLSEFDCNRLHLLDDFGSRGSYYLCINKDYKIERSVSKLINKLCKRQKIVRKIALGAFEGGTAAIYYALKYDYDTVIVETPHFYIGSHIKELPDACDILDFMANNKNQKAVNYLDDMIEQVIERKRLCQTKMIICTKKEIEETFQIQHLADALREKRIPYILNEIDESHQATDRSDLFYSELKKHLSIQVPFSNLKGYQIEITGDILTLELTTSSATDKVSVNLYINDKEIMSTRYSEKRKFYFDVTGVGVYQFSLSIINTFEHRREITSLKIEVSKTSNDIYEWIEIPVAPVKTINEIRIEKLQKEADTMFFSKIKEKINALPISNGSRYFANSMAVKIALIADKSLFEACDQIAKCTYVTPDNYQVFVDKVDVFLVASTWQGLNNEWIGLANPKSEQREQLIRMIAAYRNSGSEIVFYSEEDPEYYETFLGIAELCDYIFTTTEEHVANYQEDCGHDEVYVLRLGINPIVYNPIGFRKFRKFPGALFSGGWDRYTQYLECLQDAKMIFDGVTNNNNLKIIDKNFERQGKQEARHLFPEKYFRYISPTISEKDLPKVFKLFNWVIHISNLKYSNTIASYDAYALQASGNAILSNYNEGINNMFPHIFTIINGEEVSKIMHGFTEDELYQHQLLGIRKVMSEETSYHRLVCMMNVIGVLSVYPVRKVAVIVRNLADKVREMYHGQSYKDKELFLESELSEDVLNNFDFIAYFDDEADYGVYYLEDMINAFKYVDVDFVTKQAYYLDGELQAGIEHDYVDSYEDKMRTVFSSKNYQKLRDLDGCEGYQGYAIDPFEFKVSKAPQIAQLERCYKLSIVIPVYNNGDHLLNKAFNSLLRSVIFDEMEILIIDDGSTDGKTPRIIERLVDKYANVRAYFHPEGGSGSASRPRNKAIELATAGYIAFVDPDDEMINDGMKILYESIVDTSYDMVVGDTLIVTHSGVRSINYLDRVKKVNKGSLVVDNTKDFFVKMNFKPKRLQEIIVRRELIVQHELTMVVGGLGQDTLFFQEVVLVSKSIKFISEVVGLYYGAVDGSVMNSVSVRFFEKYFIRDKEAINRYIKHGVLKEFLKLRYEDFFVRWYLPRLKRVSDDEFVAAVNVLREIMDLYVPYYSLRNEQMIDFYQLAVDRNYRVLSEMY